MSGRNTRHDKMLSIASTVTGIFVAIGTIGMFLIAIVAPDHRTSIHQMAIPFRTRTSYLNADQCAFLALYVVILLIHVALVATLRVLRDE